MRQKINNELSAEIAAEVAEFLKKGGKVQQLPYSPEEYKENVFKKHAKRLEEARKRAMATANWRKQSVAGHSQRKNKNG